MAETLFITPDEITGTTILGGNVDPDKYITNIAMVQVAVIEPLLGTELYNKLMTDFKAGSLTGNYETLMTDFVKPITKHEALAEYIEVSNFLVENGGTFGHIADNRETKSKDDLQFLAGKYHNTAQMYVRRFEKWICQEGNTVVEYKTSQTRVNAQNVKVNAGWYFGKDEQTFFE